jgi:hypothetical protein
LIDQPDQQVFQIRYHTGRETIRETYHLTPGRLRLLAQVETAEAIRMQVPLLNSDGEAAAQLHFSESAVQLTYLGATYTVRYPAGARATLALEPIGNRNGIYRVLVVEQAGDQMEVTLDIE